MAQAQTPRPRNQAPGMNGPRTLSRKRGGGYYTIPYYTILYYTIYYAVLASPRLGSTILYYTIS